MALNTNDGCLKSLRFVKIDLMVSPWIMMPHCASAARADASNVTYQIKHKPNLL